MGNLKFLGPESPIKGDQEIWACMKYDLGFGLILGFELQDTRGYCVCLQVRIVLTICALSCGIVSETH